MKPLILLLVVAFLHTGIQAQENRAFIPEELSNQTESRSFQYPENQLNQVNHEKILPGNDEFNNDILGFSYHDMQTLGAHRQQIYEYPDGYTAAVWTYADNYLTYPLDTVIPGTIYNYKTQENEEWLPIEGNASKIEEMSSRFPSYAPYGENGEVIASQQENGINIYTRPNKGEGEWEHHLLEPSNGVPSLKYPHMITSGANNEIIHVAAVTDTSYNGQKSALLYFRSQDGGETWDKHNVILEGTGAGHYTAIHADNYCWAVQDNKLALVVSSPWIDLFYLESEDNGDNWEKHMVWEHPYPMFNFETTITENIIWCPDGSLDAIYDGTGRLHLSFGLARVKHTQPGYEYIYYPWTDGIVYWNESFDPFVAYDQHVALSYDYLEVNKTLVGWAIDTDSNNVFDYTENSILPESYPYLGLSSLPSLSCRHEDHTIYLSYLSGNEYRKCFNYHYRSPYIKTYFYNPNNEDEWLWDATLAPYETDSGSFSNEEFLYPQLSPVNYGTGHLFVVHHWRVHLYYMNGPFESRIDATEFTHSPNWPPNPLIETGLNANLLKQELKVSPNHPNPFSGQTQINVQLPTTMPMHLEVRDMQGKKVYNNQIKGYRGNNRIILPATNLKPGIYLYTVSAGEKSITRKMVVKE